MAARIGSLYVDLVMNTAGYVAGMHKASTETSRAAAAINRDLGLTQRTVNAFSAAGGSKSFRPYAIIAASRAYETANDRVNLLRGSLLALTSVAGGFGAALASNLLTRYADTALNLNNQLKTVTSSSSNLAAVQGELEAVAERSRSSLQATITLYARTARASEKLGLSQEKLLRVTETIQKSFSIGGATGAEAQGAAIQLSQGIASDRFSGEEFRSVAENAPVLLRGMAESLGVTIGKLREMAHAGELTADVVTKAILKASQRIDSEFGQTVVTLDRAITQVDNKLLQFVGNTDKAYGITALMTSGIVAFGDSLDQIIPPLVQIAGLIGAIFLARNKGAVGGGLGGLIGGSLGLATGGIEGAITGAALGGFAGFSASRKDKDGLGFISRIKADAAASRAEVVRLTSATRDLRDETWRAQQGMRAANVATTSDPISQAPKSAQSAVLRAAHELNQIEEKRLGVYNQLWARYGDMNAIAAKISPRAAKLADTQLKAEVKLNDVLQKQAAIRHGISAIGADRKASASVEGRGTADTEAEAAQRIRAQKALTAAVAAEASQREVIAQRQAKISALASESDRKAAGERLVVGRQIADQSAAYAKLEEARVAQVTALGQARVAAERAGAEVARTNLQQATQNFAGFQQALNNTVGRLELARRAAGSFSVGMRAVSRAGGDLVGLFGGPWGIAIAGASLLFAQFAISAQEHAQKIANAKRLIDETLQEGGPSAGQAGSLLAREIAAVEANIRTVQEGAAAARLSLDRLFNVAATGDQTGVQGIVNAWKALTSLPIQGRIDELRDLTNLFISGQVGVVEFRAEVRALQETASDPAFDEMARQVLDLGNNVAAEGYVLDQFKQKIIDLQIAAKDPINLVITTTFDSLDAQPIDAPLTNATNQFASGLGFTRQLDGELKTLRLVGDARKEAEYTDDQIKKAEKDGVVVTEAVRKRIAAYVDEKIALEARDAAVKQSAKDDPFEKAIQSIREKVAAQQVENEMLGQTTYAIEREKAIRELEIAAIEAKIALTPDLQASILSEAEAYATVAQASEDLQKKREAEKAQFEFYKSTFTSFFSELKGGLMEGASLWDAFSAAAINALNNIADRALALATDGIFDMLLGTVMSGVTGGAGAGLGIGQARYGGSGGMFGIPGFDAGGFTGRGPKNKAAGLVHKGEYVFDAETVRRLGVKSFDAMRGYANGGMVGSAPSPLPAMFGQPDSEGGSGRTRVLLELSPGLEARILEQAADQSVEIVNLRSPGAVAKAERNRIK